MGQRGNYAAVMDAQIELSKEECAAIETAADMSALLMDATIGPSIEECASDMGQKSNSVGVKDAQIKLYKQECACGMGQRSNYAVGKDAQIMLGKVEYARGMSFHCHQLFCSLLDRRPCRRKPQSLHRFVPPPSFYCSIQHSTE